MLYLKQRRNIKVHINKAGDQDSKRSLNTEVKLLEKVSQTIGSN